MNRFIELTMLDGRKVYFRKLSVQGIWQTSLNNGVLCTVVCLNQTAIITVQEGYEEIKNELYLEEAFRDVYEALK